MVTLYTVLHIHLLHWGLPQPSPVTTVLLRHRSQQSVETQQSWDQRGWRPCTECQSCNSVLLYPRELFLCAYILHCCHRLKVVYSYYLLWILAAVCLFAVVWCAREIFLFSVQFKKKNNNIWIFVLVQISSGRSTWKHRYLNHRKFNEITVECRRERREERGLVQV